MKLLIIQDFIITLIIVILALITIAFTVHYCKLLSMGQKEYAKAKNIIREIVIAFKRTQDRQKLMIDQLTFQSETAHSAVERMTIYFQGLEKRLKSLVTTVESLPITYEETFEKVNLIEKNFDKIKETQQNIKKQLITLEERIGVISKGEIRTSVPNNSRSDIKLTETERTILQLLMDEGAKTSPQIEVKVGKTREHTARLMKKLWQEGYIERDTHLIPYIYRITEGLKKLKIQI